MKEKCKKIQEQMNMYIDGELKEKDLAAFLDHLAGCEKCRDEFNSLKFMLSLVKEIDVVTPPAELKQSVMAKIKDIELNKDREPVRIPFFRKPVFAALSAAVCFVVIAAVLVFSNGGLLGGGARDADMLDLQSEIEADKNDDNNLGIMEITPEDVHFLRDDHIFDVSIKTTDNQKAADEIISIIINIPENEFDESTTIFHPISDSESELIVYINRTQGKLIINELKERFDDITVIEQELKEGHLRIIISE